MDACIAFSCFGACIQPIYHLPHATVETIYRYCAELWLAGNHRFEILKNILIDSAKAGPAVFANQQTYSQEQSVAAEEYYRRVDAVL
jgi:hypothetical protein